MRILITARALLLAIVLASPLAGCTARNSGGELDASDGRPADSASAAEYAAESSQTAAPDRHAWEDTRFIHRELARDCPGCNFANIDLHGADLTNANLVGANLSEADLRNANLRRANLRGAELEGTNLSGADLGGAILQGANLRRSNLTGANLYQADLREAILEEIIGTSFEGALR